jgi:hypothetical protein
VKILPNKSLYEFVSDIKENVGLGLNKAFVAMIEGAIYIHQSKGKISLSSGDTYIGTATVSPKSMK